MKLAVVAGEASGDLHAAEVVHELKKLDPQLRAFGIGGDRLGAAGVELLHHARELGIVGLFDVLRHLPMFRRVFRELIEKLERERPDAVLLVDYPGFNLRVARRAKALGIRVVYYISPQIWAWRRSRVRHVRRYVDRMLVILPFEEAFYGDHGVRVTYVGHPLIEQLHGIRRPGRGDILRIALLPGSRHAEVASLLPPMLDAVTVLQRERPVDAYVIEAPTIRRQQTAAILAEKRSSVRVIEHDDGRSLAAADVALSSSGTATLEAAILGTPAVVMYRLTAATFWLGKRLVKVPHFSLVNIIAGKEVVPELLQHDVNGDRIAAEVRRLLDPQTYAAVQREIVAVRERLGEPGASRRAAEAIMGELRR